MPCPPVSSNMGLTSEILTTYTKTMKIIVVTIFYSYIFDQVYTFYYYKVLSAQFCFVFLPENDWVILNFAQIDNFKQNETHSEKNESKMW